MVALDQLSPRRYARAERQRGAGMFCRHCVSGASEITPERAHNEFLTTFLNLALTNNG